MSEQEPLRTGPSDKLGEHKTAGNQHKLIDTAKQGLKPQKHENRSNRSDEEI